ncbi:type I secretion system permease/ATPase [Helicobacter monodelphidis]|uniref:type I secretion system permease/ATPase n=1 Tax=Helicobacter sp. 15-1451 TaxID=2004995 RepID=UPI000DCD59B0|nr:type I secretion system permease/ATPase [Helicobacter sp. 15-1451]RAX58365.1 type I secretion system permease/ATPase [Helicobacter sp. 15-1451]
MLAKINQVNIPRNELTEVIKASKQAFMYVMLASFFINLLMLTPTLYMLQMYDRVLASRSVETLLMLTIVAVFFFIVMGCLEFVRSRLLVRAGNQIDNRLRNRLFNLTFTFANLHPGMGNTQAMNDLTQVRQFMTGTPIFAFFDLPWVFIYLGILFLFHPYFGFFAIFAGAVIFSLTLVNEWRTRKGLEESNRLYQMSTGFLNSSLRNAEVVEAMGMREHIRKRWIERYMDYHQVQTAASDEAGIWTNLSKSLRLMFQSLILGLGAYLVIQSELTPGMMIAGSIVMGRALAPMDLLTGSWKQFIAARAAYQRLVGLLAEIPVTEKPMALPMPQGNVSVEAISVIPPNSRQIVVKNVSLEIHSGEIVGIIGPSAAGKSSLARVMLGIWKPYLGKIRYDGADIEHYDRIELGEHLGYLPQDIELFEGSIAENIARYGEVDSKMVLDAAKMAGVHDMILQFPNGYDTPIGPGGIALSGGQRQRIALARAIYGFPQFILLDEPNSNLDDTGERALLQAILNLKERGITVVLITHRMAVLNATDKIALMKDGTLQGYGPREEILKMLAAQAQQNAITK